jgi:hypothetical protein
MLHSARVAVFAASLSLLAATIAAQNLGTPPPGSRQPSTDYGAGSYSTQQTNSAGATLVGTVYDSNDTPRRTETDQYATSNGKQYRGEKHEVGYDLKGHLDWSLDLRYLPTGEVLSSDFSNFGLHGERTSEERINYQTDGYHLTDWSLGKHDWTSQFLKYTYPTTAGTNTPAPVPYGPTNTTLGVLLPRNYHPGDTVTGSIWPSTYADGFKTVPGLSEFDFTVPLRHLPDGSPLWSDLEIGVKGDGYLPIRSTGLFTVHIPPTWSGPLQLQVREPDPLAGLAPNTATLNMGNPLAAPALPGSLFPSKAVQQLNYFSHAHLIDLWNDAYDYELDLDDAYDSANPDWDYIDWLECELDDIYGAIDHVTAALPTNEVVALAKSLADDSFSSGWASFLEDEAAAATYRAYWQPLLGTAGPYWTTPILTQGKLNAVRGWFYDNPLDTHIRVDNYPVMLIGATPYETYFMPPLNLTAGLHNEYIDSPLFGETILPTFYMTLTMTADDLHLHKGQSTKYHLRLDGLNGLPGGAWSNPFYPTDIVGSSEISAGQQAAGNSLKGYITLSVTNQSPTVITMQDQFRTLDASLFAPSGSYQLDGGIGAIKDGGFSVLGIARAFLSPVAGLGSQPSSTSPSPGSFTPSWYPPFSWNYDPNTFSNSPFMSNCLPLAGGAIPSQCPDSVIRDILNRYSSNSSSAPADSSTISSAQQHVTDSKAQSAQANSSLSAANDSETKAWNNALSHLMQSDRDDWTKITTQYKFGFDNWKLARNQFRSDSSLGSFEKLESAKSSLADNQRDYWDMRLHLSSEFSAADRTAWQSANDAAKKAAATAGDAAKAANLAQESLSGLQPKAK